MILRAAAVGLALATAAGGVTVAVRSPWPAAASPAPPAPAVSVLALPAAAPAVSCPGPETSIVPEGSAPQPVAGVVTLTTASSTTATGSADVLVRERLGDVTAPVRLGGPAAAGEPAPVGVQTTLVRGGDRRGLAAVACQAATTDAWLVGGATSTGRRARLLLLDPTPATAVVDVAVLGPRGPVDLPSAQGLVVAPGGARALQLDALAPGLDVLAVHVVARRGRIAAVLDDSRLDGATPAGIDDVPVAAAPSRHLTLPAVVVPAPPLGGSASATIRLAVPGPDDAVVHLRLSGVAGLLPLPGDGVVTVPAGSVTEVPLRVAAGSASSVLVDADVPVLAAARVEVAGRPAGPLRRPAVDLAWTAATPPLAGRAVLAVPRPAMAGPRELVPVPAVTELVLTAGDADVDVQLRLLGPQGEPRGTPAVHVGAGRTVSVPVTGAAALSLALPPGRRLTAGIALVLAQPSGPLVTLVPATATAAVAPGRLLAVPDPWLLGQSSQSSSLP